MPGCSRLGAPVKRETVRKKKTALEIIHFQTTEIVKLKFWKGNRKESLFVGRGTSQMACPH